MKKIKVELEVTPQQAEALLRMAERGFLPDRLRWADAEAGIAALRNGIILGNAAVAKRRAIGDNS